MKKIALHCIVTLLFGLVAATSEGASDKPKPGGTLTLGIYRDLEIMDIPEIYLGFVPEFFTFRHYVKGFATNDDGNFQWSGGGLSRAWIGK